MLKNTTTAMSTPNKTTPPAPAPIMMPTFELETGAGVDGVDGVDAGGEGGAGVVS